jgi:hypothetical protein
MELRTLETVEHFERTELRTSDTCRYNGASYFTLPTFSTRTVPVEPTKSVTVEF